jgi:hypothetical protein
METGGKNVPIDQISCPRGPSGRGVDAGAEGLIAAVSAAGQSMEGKGGGCCCDIDIVRDLRPVERGTVGGKESQGEEAV